jgi:hypothetical protein
MECSSANQATTTGNKDVMLDALRQLSIQHKELESSSSLIPISGDQLSIVRLRTLQYHL